MKIKTRFSFLLVVFIAVLFFTQPAMAQDPQPTVSDDEVNQVAQELYCPVCENVPLDVCPTTACEQWRALIREKLNEGWSNDQITEYFVAQYGDRVLSEPPRRGLNWLVYILPPIFFLGGLFLVVRVINKMKTPKRDQDIPVEGQQIQKDPYVQQLEEELRRNSDE